MKKTVLLSILLTALVFSGCGQAPLTDYRKALQQTNAMVSGVEEVKITFSYQFADQYPLMLAHWSPHYHHLYKFDKSTDVSVLISEIQFNKPKLPNYYVNQPPLSGPEQIKYDMTLYTEGNKSYLTSSIFTGYMVADSLTADLSPGLTGYILGLDSIPMIIEKMVHQVEEATRIDNVVLNNPDGLVKTKVFSLHINTEAAMEILGPLGYDQAEVTGFTYFAYIDKDNFIVREELTIRLKIFRSPAPFRAAVVTWEIDRYNINRKQDIRFDLEGPEIDALTMQLLMEAFIEDQFRDDE